MNHRAFVGLLVFVFSLVQIHTALSVEFEQDVLPILKTNCFECHSGSNVSGGLVLDDRDKALSGGKNGALLKAGQAQESIILQVLKGTHDKVPQMPFGRDPLPEEEIARIEAWINQGADWPEIKEIKEDKQNLDHWAYKQPVRPELPQIENEHLANNPIDYFILAKLEEQGLTLSPRAEKFRLLRRLSLDLTGLVPSPEQVQKFLQDDTPNAYEKQVNRLLDSPHYGEHRARYWLDVARYADSHGYQVDRPRSMWPYRDWVIEAFNQNKPFDEFTIEQIAGDLLPNPSTDQLIATGFHRNTKVNEEGGVDPEEFRRAAVVDRVDTTATAFLGTTIACAECHNHKYDPISQKEFYQFYAFFNNTTDRGHHGGLSGKVPPILYLPDEKIKNELAFLQDQIDTLQKQYDEARQTIDAELKAWEKRWHRDTPTSWIPLEAEKYESNLGANVEKHNDLSLFFDAPEDPMQPDTYKVLLESPKVEVHGVRLEILPDKRLPKGGTGHSIDGNFVISEVRVFEALRKKIHETNPLKLKSASVEYSQNGFPVKNVIDGDPETGWAVAPRVNEEFNLVVELEKPLSFRNGQNLLVEIDQNEMMNHKVGRIRVSVSMTPKGQRIPLLPYRVEQIVGIPPDQRSEKQWDRLRHYFAENISPTLSVLGDSIQKLQQRKQEAYQTADYTMIMGEREKPRETHIHIRGNFLNPGEQVQPAVPTVFHDMKKDWPRNRLGLAKWLVSEENPLIARVTVNRFWQQLFGTGLVKTAEDFGTQGDPPSHPKLLDWLAVEFIESGWDVKHIFRLMVSSAAYQQTSRVDDKLLEIDPHNRLITRGPRFRMDAEMIRDNALFVSGLLNQEIGGPSVFPPQPPGLWKEIGFLRPEFGMSRWPESEGEDRYRRGMYTFWRRTITYPSFSAFDAPSREVCIVKRERTNTPLQALVTLNDPAFVEAAQALAYRLLTQGGKTHEDKISYAFQLCLSRDPKPKEMQRLLDLLAQQKINFASEPALAQEMIKPNLLDDINANDMNPQPLAAWTVISNVMLNLDEFLTKG